MTTQRKRQAQRRTIARERRAEEFAAWRASYEESGLVPGWERVGNAAKGHRLAYRLTLDPSPLLALAQLRMVREQGLPQLERMLVAQARFDGATWAEVGVSLGMTHSGAIHRHGGADQVPPYSAPTRSTARTQRVLAELSPMGPAGLRDWPT